MSDRDKRIETLLLHAGQQIDPFTRSRAAPIYQTTSYAFESAKDAADLFALRKPGYIYTRLGNPTNDVAEKRIAAMEGGVGALLTSSGMAAIFLAVNNLAAAGDHIVSSASLYGGTDTLFRYSLKRMGVETTFVKDATPEAVKRALKPNTKAVYAETIGNPKCDVPDFDGIAAAAHEAGLPLVVDNTFAPVLSRPFDFGADVVIHSLTKWIGGHGRAIGGAIVDSGRFDWANGKFAEFTEPDESYNGTVYWELGKSGDGTNSAFIAKARLQGMRNLGPCASPQNAALFLQGLETLPLRIREQSNNALKLALWLKEHPKVERVIYPGLPENAAHENALKYLSGGFGAVLGFCVKGGISEGAAFIDAMELVSHVANVGDSKTLALHPASTTHAQVPPADQLAIGITPNFIRVSVGLENFDDLADDFNRALSKA